MTTQENRIVSVRMCSDCRWGGDPSRYDDQTPVVVTGIECRRNAPIATGGMMSPLKTVWPIVGLNDWCGDFIDPPVEF